LKNKQTVSFINCFDSFSMAQDMAKTFSNPSIILHMYYGDKEIFAICGQESITMINQTFSDEVLKEKSGKAN
jgi:hypothetical protein